MSAEQTVVPVVAKRRELSAPDRLVLFVARHWLFLVNLAVFIFVGLPVAAPFLAEAGLTRPAMWIYLAYRVTCHQLPHRSYFIGGPKIDYTFAEVQQVTGASTLYDLVHHPLVNSPLGSQIAFCHRDLAIYATVLLAGLLFGVVRQRLKPLPFWAFLLFLVPIAVDGFTQLLGGIVPFLPPRESTWLLRTLTGGLMGLGGVWFAFPYIERGMQEVQRSYGSS